MGMPDVKIKVGATKIQKDPNQIQFVSFGGVPRPLVKKSKIKRYNPDGMEAVIYGFLSLFFVWIPLLAFFIYCMPKFFMGLFIVIATVFGVYKFAKRIV